MIIRKQFAGPKPSPVVGRDLAFLFYLPALLTSNYAFAITISSAR